MPAFVRHSLPLSGTVKAQGSCGDGRRQRLSSIAVGSHWAAEAVKGAGADRKS